MSEINHETNKEFKGTKKSATDSSITSKKRVYSRKSCTKLDPPKKTKAVNICFCTVSLRRIPLQTQYRNINMQYICLF